MFSVRLSARLPSRPSTAGNVDRNSSRNARRSTGRNYHVYCTDRKQYDGSRALTPSIQDIEREKYSFKPSIRPLSAPQTSLSRRRVASMSAKVRGTRGQVKIHSNGKEDMFGVVRAAKEAKTFEEDSKYYHQIEQSFKEPENDDEKKDAAPVFNKRLFASQGAVIITQEARRLMAINALANEKCDLDSLLSKTEVQCLRCVVDGLKLIHKGQDFVKDVLSKVVSYEVYEAFNYVPTKSWEDYLACYYILNGAVEVTYDLRSTESRNVFQANIIYSHGTGEYLGLVSAEGPTEDLAPPATIYTKELTQFIRVDRQRFHQLMKKATRFIDKRKRDYISSHSFLAKISEEIKEKILHKLAIQEYPANRVLLSQGEVTEYLFIIMSGRCQTYREVHIPEAEKEVLFYLTSRDPDDFFGEECVLDNAPSICTIVTATATTIIKLHRSALKMVNRDKLSRFIDEQRHDIPSDENLRDRGYRDSLWNKYKHTQIKGSLKEGGKLQYLTRANSALVRERPLEESELYTENMRRFVMKGSQFDPMRAQSANTTGSHKHQRQKRRPHTAFASLVMETLESSSEDDSEKENEFQDEDTRGLNQDRGQSSLLTVEKAKEMEHHITKAMESKESLLKVLDEPGEVSSHLRQAWKAEGGQETQNFMKNGVLVTMTSEDIVRKAKALADTYADKWKQGTNENEEDWDTILHAENKQAKMLITANKLRIKDIKRRLADLQKRRERVRQQNKPRRADYFSDDDDDEEIDEENVLKEIRKERKQKLILLNKITLK
ncbi:uncharacterized protein LOC123527817 isoform X3 [Mercenaria mercenaria]|uniref:uncharacterized protein LOC123527817 isoform X2 n=1 Tax=Mercenaria mercenaria TaxID=6596 RepID=UPI00234E994D|nr:uncharacterized protein LOC123527817 isoform X2 [Mercenaria mercenaria]XP_053379701.1 uncharacterized protein LOC123527817 isoform X3 [Mercenaria mercenaria]